MSAPAFDYAPVQANAQAQILRFGRNATLTRTARETTANPTAGKPWLAQQGDDDLGAASAQSIAVQAVFLSLDRTDRGGQVVEAKTQGVLIGGATVLPEEVGPDWKLTEAAADGGRVWEVLSSKPLKPGPTLLLYRLELVL